MESKYGRKNEESIAYRKPILPAALCPLVAIENECIKWDEAVTSLKFLFEAESLQYFT